MLYYIVYIITMIIIKNDSKKDSKKYSKKDSKKYKLKGGAGTNDPIVAFNIIKKAGIDIANEIDIIAIVKDLFTLLYDILTGGEKTEKEFTRRVLEQLYNFTGGNNCAIKKELCSNTELLNQIKLIYDKIYTTLENGVFSYATNAIAVVPVYGPAAVAVINTARIGYKSKRDIYDKFKKALKLVDKIKTTTESVASAKPPDVKTGGTKKHKQQKKLTTKQIKHIANTYLQFLNLILYVKKKYKPNKLNKTNKLNKLNKTKKRN